MNPCSKLSISVLFTVALLTGFLSLAYVQRAHAFSVDFSGLPGFGGDQGLNFFQGLKGFKEIPGQLDLKDYKAIKAIKAIKEKPKSKVQQDKMVEMVKMVKMDLNDLKVNKD